jgi:hypothetical protein
MDRVNVRNVRRERSRTSSSYFAMFANEFCEGYEFRGGYGFAWLPERWRQLRNQPLRSSRTMIDFK